MLITRVLLRRCHPVVRAHSPQLAAFCPTLDLPPPAGSRLAQLQELSNRLTQTERVSFKARTGLQVLARPLMREQLLSHYPEPLPTIKEINERLQPLGFDLPDRRAIARHTRKLKLRARGKELPKGEKQESGRKRKK